MSRGLSTNCFSVSVIAAAWLVGASVAFVQSTAFTYQGKLTDGSNPVNGN
jgi:hypothetical protein